MTKSISKEVPLKLHTTEIARGLRNSSEGQHVMLLYEDELKRKSVEVDCINASLSEGQYCVYATVDANDQDFVSRISSKISDYEKHVRENNLLIINFKPYYDSAARGELSPFKQLKAHLEETLKDRKTADKNQKALVIADAACNLTKHKQFDECITLESWWQNTYNEWKEKNLDISIICAHPSAAFKQELSMSHQMKISKTHSVTIDIDKIINRQSNRQSNRQVAVTDPTFVRSTLRPLHILVVEPEQDIRTMYARYFRSLPVEVVAVESGIECLEKTIMQDNVQEYDVIIIDTHIRDTSAFRLAKNILDEKPDQKLVFCTTWSLGTIESELESHSLVGNCRILQKPFLFSQLLSLIEPARQ